MYIIQISLHSYQKENLYYFQQLINKIYFNLNLKKLKNKKFSSKSLKKKFTILKSPHVNSKSREHFNFEFYKNKIIIYEEKWYLLINILILLKKIIKKNIYLKIKIKYIFKIKKKHIKKNKYIEKICL